jgi:very-short-patch-repair endonuclease
LIFKSPPCLKGGGCKAAGGIKMERKHNPTLSKNAKNLRKNMTKEERHLWYDFLRNYPIRFLRQKVIDDYIVDFYCHEARLIIELDGSQHYEENAMIKDRIRTEIIEQRNFIVIRIPNNEINQNFRGVCEYIDTLVRSKVLYPPVKNQ